MSIFSKWFKVSQSGLEKELEEMYTRMLSHWPTGMTKEYARMQVKAAIELCKEQGIKEGTDNLPNNYGDLLINGSESEAPILKKRLENARKEGATDNDIREFWNLNDLQRRMVLWSEDLFRLSTFLQATENGMTKEDALLQIRKIFPMYGDPDDTKNSSGDDRPLPHEIRGRVDVYREKIGAAFIKDRVERFTTYNAFIRDEIRKGNL